MNFPFAHNSRPKARKEEFGTEHLLLLARKLDIPVRGVSTKANLIRQIRHHLDMEWQLENTKRLFDQVADDHFPYF